MGERNDGLGLSLSLKCPENNLPPPPPPPPPPPLKAPVADTAPFPLNLLSSPPFSFIHRHDLQNHVQNHQKCSFLLNHAPPPPPDLNAERGYHARGIDVNKTPSTSTAVAAECEEEAVVSSPNSTVSSVSGKRAERENEEERDSSLHGVSAEEEEEEDCGDAAAARKKHRLSKDQATVLEETFKEHNTLNPKQKVALAKQLDLRPRQVEVWFQNRRARTKLKQTEVDCEYLKRCCETLTDENKRLQKEVNELRALKLSPGFYMNTNPPTTLTMCPQCERVSASTSVPTSKPLGPNSFAKALNHGPMELNNSFLPRDTVVPHRPFGARHPRC